MAEKQKQIRFTVRLNGTSENPWHKFGLTMNPFPQIARHEYMRGMMMVNSLDGDPLKGEEDIRQRLRGCSPEFVDLCVRRFKPGERVEFDVYFPE